MPWTNERVIQLRTRLGLTQTEFAKVIGVDVRSIARWEAGQAVPSGPGEAVLNALQATLDRHPEKEADIVGWLAGAVAIGGLAFILIALLEGLFGGGKPGPKPK